MPAKTVNFIVKKEHFIFEWSCHAFRDMEYWPCSNFCFHLLLELNFELIYNTRSLLLNTTDFLGSYVIFYCFTNLKTKICLLRLLSISENTRSRNREAVIMELIRFSILLTLMSNIAQAAEMKMGLYRVVNIQRNFTCSSTENINGVRRIGCAVKCNSKTNKTCIGVVSIGASCDLCFVCQNSGSPKQVPLTHFISKGVRFAADLQEGKLTAP